MEKWHKFFESSGVDALTVCERALTVAFHDNAEAFLARRDKLAHMLFAPEKLDPKACEADAPPLSYFTSSLSGILLENKAHPNLSNCAGVEEEEEDERKGDAKEKNGDNSHKIGEISSNEAHDEVELLYEEMDQEVFLRRDIIKIKEMLDSHKILSEKEILKYLDRLNLMKLSVEILKDTKIGYAVNPLRKNTSMRVKSFAKKLVRDWKDLVDEWAKSVKHVANATIIEGIPTSTSPNDDMAEEHGGLPIPPMDEAALLATSQTTPMEICKLSEFMDNNDDSLLNSQGGAGRTMKLAFDRRSSSLSKPILTKIKISATSRGGGGGGMRKSEHESKQNKERAPPFVAGEAGSQRIKLGGNNGGIARNGCRNYVPHARASISSNEFLKEKAKTTICGSKRNGVVGGRTALNLGKKDDDYIEKLMVSKRKLHENYQKAEIAKKQRTIKVLKLQELPKGGRPK